MSSLSQLFLLPSRSTEILSRLAGDLRELPLKRKPLDWLGKKHAMLSGTRPS